MKKTKRGEILEKGKERRKRRLRHYLIPIIAIVWTGVFTALLFSMLEQRKQADDTYRELVADTVMFRHSGKATANANRMQKGNTTASDFPALSESENEKESTDSLTSVTFDYPKLKIDFAKLRAINSDFICFLYIPALDCAYPVVHSADNSEYLTKDFYGKRSPDGAIFLDRYSSPDFSDANSLIFGHNMRSGSMFGCLKRFYKDETLADKSPYFYLYTDTGVRRYQIFGYGQISTEDSLYSLSTDYENEETYDNLIERVRGFSPHLQDKEGTDFKLRPPIVTLSTCYGNGSTRFVVFGALTGQEVDESQDTDPDS